MPTDDTILYTHAYYYIDGPRPIDIINMSISSSMSIVNITNITVAVAGTSSSTTIID